MIVVAVIASIGAAKANPLQIQEARAELARINSSKGEAQRTLAYAEAAYQALRSAARRQQKALELLVKADEAKQLAQRNSVNAVDNGHNSQAYFADQGHSTGTALLIERPRYVQEELEGYQRGS
jgi:uncharacterized membrane-anchored protein